MNAATKIVVMIAISVAATLPSSAGTMSKAEYVENCSTGKHGGPPQSKELCSCIYDKVANEASKNSKLGILLGGGDGQVKQTITDPELIAEVFRIVQECGVKG